jgi:ABC-type oligopeptide transport system ATPase subunit
MAVTPDASPSAEPKSAPDVVLEARDVTKEYPARSRRNTLEQALGGVTVTIRSGETLGVVGESGSGKTTLSRLLLGIERPTSGVVLFRGVPLRELDKTQLRQYRRSVAAVFQNPYSSLDPRMRVWNLITEQLVIDGRKNQIERRNRADELLSKVGLDVKVAERYPHQLSGGQRQRVAIARALVSDPDVVILDEALSSLDVSVRAQIVNLLLDLQDSLHLTYLFIAHDLTMVRHICNWIVVMHRGRIAEEGPGNAMFDNPKDPYTAALIEASYLGETPSAATRTDHP